jgi:hypothetical protein
MSGAPGFWIGNVIVMAGVPSIMQAMLDEVAPKLKIGVYMLSETVRADAREGDIGVQLGEIAKANPEVAIGSYPFFDQQHGPNTNARPRCPEARAGQTCWSECGEHNQRVPEPIYIRLRIWRSGAQHVERFRRAPRRAAAVELVRSGAPATAAEVELPAVDGATH